MNTEKFNVVPTTLSFNLATPFSAVQIKGWSVVDSTTGDALFETSFQQDIYEFIETLRGLRYRSGDTHLALMVEELWTLGESTAEQMLADNFPVIDMKL